MDERLWQLTTIQVLSPREMRIGRRQLALLPRVGKLGATREGILRGYMISPRNSPRNVAIYSILAHEWPDLRAKLQARLG